MKTFKHVSIGPETQKHGFQLAITTGCGFRLTIYCKTAEEERNAAFNIDRKYGDIKAMSIMGY